MKLDGFKEYLQERKLDTDKIGAAVNIINEFRTFLSRHKKSVDTASYDDIYNFSAYLIENETNIFENYVNLLRFGYFTKNNEVIVASLEIIDGSEMIENFSKLLIAEFGEKVRNEIFEGIGIPPLGIHPSKKPEIIKKLVDRFLARVGSKKCKEFFEIGLRDKYTESYKKPTELFQQINNVDEFLRIRHQNLIKTLENHLQKGTLFFTQEVDKEVISYVKKNPTIESGLREGSRVIITKIPYMAKQFIHETDEKKKRYYYCHNPWIREALIDEEQPITPLFCGCSAGYFKNFWEAVLDQPVRVEVLESVIGGDKICKFALHLPQEIIDEIEKSI
ncbi:MAG: hypothetical protein ACFFBD_09040 [Candidatus Hodarchaeota archaeon]